MANQYMEISQNDKEIIMMTGKLLAGKRYHPADVAILLIDKMSNSERVKKDLE